jgi:hypothetical protein
MMSSDLTDIHDLQARSKTLLPGLEGTPEEAFIRDALALIASQEEQIATLRELKDGYYTSMAQWREAHQEGVPFAEIQQKYEQPRQN